MFGKLVVSRDQEPTSFSSLNYRSGLAHPRVGVWSLSLRGHTELAKHTFGQLWNKYSKMSMWFFSGSDGQHGHCHLVFWSRNMPLGLAASAHADCRLSCSCCSSSAAKKVQKMITARGGWLIARLVQYRYSGRSLWTRMHKPRCGNIGWVLLKLLWQMNLHSALACLIVAMLAGHLGPGWKVSTSFELQ